MRETPNPKPQTSLDPALLDERRQRKDRDVVATLVAVMAERLTRSGYYAFVIYFFLNREAAKHAKRKSKT